MPAVIELTGITKRFPGVLANDRLALQVASGEIHALVGENGAGKSTLMKILYGLYQPDAGVIAIRGRQEVLDSPRRAIELGIGMVHQHFMLIPRFTVAENVVLGSEPTHRGHLALETARERIRALCEQYGFALDPDARVESLSVGEQQRVEIIKVLYRGAEVLILDEPTAVLTPQEIDDLFSNLRRLRAEGKTIIFIRVDLPAPFSPTRAWISPGSTASEMRSLARTPGNRLVIPASSTTAAMSEAGAATGAAPAGAAI